MDSKSEVAGIIRKKKKKSDEHGIAQRFGEKWKQPLHHPKVLIPVVWILVPEVNFPALHRRPTPHLLPVDTSAHSTPLKSPTASMHQFPLLLEGSQDAQVGSACKDITSRR